MSPSNTLVHRDFDALQSPNRPRVTLRLGLEHDIPAAYRLIRQHMPPPYASPAVMKAMLRINSNTLVLFEQGGAIIGFHAALFLSTEGLERLLTAQLNALEPEHSSLVSAQSRPAAVYIWMVIAPGRAVEGMLHMAETLRHPLYAGADLYAKPATTEGRQLMLSLGYEPVPRSSTNLYRYVRLQNRSAEQCST